MATPTSRIHAHPRQRARQDEERPQPLPACDPDQCACQPQQQLGDAKRLTILTLRIHCLRLQRHAAPFESLTGVSVRVECVDQFNSLNDEILSDVRTRAGLYDGYMFGPMIAGDLSLLDGLHDLTPFVKDVENSGLMRWMDMFRFQREHGAVYDRKVLLIPLDGDVLSFYYRTDLFEKYGKVPPRTWEEYRDLAAFFHGKVEPLPNSTSGESARISGSCVGRKPGCEDGYYTIMILASMTQYGGTRTGWGFDPRNMNPLLGEAFVKALQYQEEHVYYGADNEYENCWDQVNVRMMNEGRCAMTYDWGDSFAEHAKEPPTSFIKGFLGTTLTPGSRRYLDRETQKLTPCTKDVCSCMDGDGDDCINSAPHSAFTGWVGGCNNFVSTAQKKACSEFFAYVSSPDVSLLDVIPNVTDGAPFISADPYRTTHTAVGEWVERGFPENSTSAYLDTIKRQFSDGNAVLDIRFPVANQLFLQMYQLVSAHLQQVKKRKDEGLAEEDALSTDEERWKVEGQLRQAWVDTINKYDEENSHTVLENYQRDLGIYAPPVDLNQITSVRPAGLTLASIIVVCCVVCAAWVYKNRSERVVRASQPFFLMMICGGTFVMGASIFPLSIDDSIASTSGCSIACMAFWWLFPLGFTTAFSAVFSKIWRVNKIFNNPRFKKIVVTERDVLVPFGVLITLDLCFLVAWTVTDPLQWERTTPGEGDFNSYGDCVADGNASTVFMAFIGAVNACPLVLACLQAYRARSISDEYSESKYLAMAVVSWLQVFLVGLPLLFLVDDNPSADYFLKSALIFALCISILALIFVPKLIFLKQHKQKKKKKSFRRRPTPVDSALTSTGAEERPITSDSTQVSTTEGIRIVRYVRQGIDNESEVQLLQMQLARSQARVEELEKIVEGQNGNVVDVDSMSSEEENFMIDDDAAKVASFADTCFEESGSQEKSEQHRQLEASH